MQVFLTIVDIGKTVFFNIFNSIYNFFTSSLGTLLANSNSVLGDVLTNFFSLFGLDLSIPMWQFLVNNIGLFIIIHLVAYLLKAIPVL